MAHSVPGYFQVHFGVSSLWREHQWDADAPWTAAVVCLRLKLLICFLCRYERIPDGMAAPGFPSSLQRQAVVRALTHRHRLWEYTFGVLK